MNKIITGLTITGILIAPLVGLAQAQPPGALPSQPPDTTVWDILSNLLNILFVILLSVAVIFFIIAGFYFITAQGDTDKIAKARQFVLWAVIGLLVAFAGWAFVYLVNQITGGGGGVTP